MKILLNDPGEFGGLPQIVALWRAANGIQRSSVGLNFPALAELLDRANEYMSEIQAHLPVTEAAPAPATVDWLAIRQAIRSTLSPKCEIDSAGYDLAAVAVCDLLYPGHAGRMPLAVPATDHKNPTVAAIDNLLREVPAGLSEMYGHRDWLNLAVHLAAKATAETTPERVKLLADLSDTFTYLAVSVAEIEEREGVRRDG